MVITLINTNMKMIQHLHIQPSPLLCFPCIQLPTLAIIKSTQTHTEICDLISPLPLSCPSSSKLVTLPNYSSQERPSPYILNQHDSVNCDTSLLPSYIRPVTKSCHPFLITAFKSTHFYHPILVPNVIIRKMTFYLVYL